MEILKKLLLGVLVLVGVGAGIVLALRHVPEEKWNGVAIGPDQIQPLIASGLENIDTNGVTEQLSSLRDKVLGVKEEVPTSSDEASTQASASLPQKTLDYARYSYCKAVVEEYEAQQTR